MNSLLVITMGDYNGIGPEVAAKALLQSGLKKDTVVWSGLPSVLEAALQQFAPDLPLHRMSHDTDIRKNQLNLLSLPEEYPTSIQPGTLSADAGLQAMLSIDLALQFCTRFPHSALITSPISKEAISLAGYHVPGHTEYLAQKTETNEVLMILTSSSLTVALCTIHVPLRQVADMITPETLSLKLTLFKESLIKDFGISDPSIAVLGLNPHAGDGGVLGSEEVEIIRPLLSDLNRNEKVYDGPYPADGFFASGSYKKYDGIFAMYHDQGLIPFKALSFGQGVNFSAGLPLIRTSPDHGTAFEIAGKELADPSSFLEACQLASTMIRNRRKSTSERTA